MEHLSLIFRSGWGLPAVVAAACGAVLLCGLWNRPARGALSRPMYVALTGLQVLAALLLTLWLVNPRLRYPRNSAEDGGLAIVLDTSVSMDAPGPRDGRSRYGEARHLLATWSPADPPHSWDECHRQWNGGRNDGFVTEHAGPSQNQVMGYHERDQLPALYALADGGAVCDRWFCSLLGPTWPNRFYLHGFLHK